MKKGSTVILRGVVVLIGLLVLAICALILPPALIANNVGTMAPILLGLYVPAIPFFIALYQTMRILHNIDTASAFSIASVNALRVIKGCAIAISALFTLGVPYIYYVAEIEDAPGVLLVALIIIFASAVIATATAVLQQLVQNAVDIKSENDLTV